MEIAGEVHLPSWHWDHFTNLKCKNAPAYAVIRMKRTHWLYINVFKRVVPRINLVPYQGWGFFMLIRTIKQVLNLEDYLAPSQRQRLMYSLNGRLHLKFKEEERCKND